MSRRKSPYNKPLPPENMNLDDIYKLSHHCIETYQMDPEWIGWVLDKLNRNRNMVRVFTIILDETDEQYRRIIDGMVKIKRKSYSKKTRMQIFHQMITEADPEYKDILDPMIGVLWWMVHPTRKLKWNYRLKYADHLEFLYVLDLIRDSFRLNNIQRVESYISNQCIF